MIPGFTDHAANERTFLAWVRTGIAMIAFGFVIEKFNLFLLALATEALRAPAAQLVKFSGRGGRYDGLALIFGGVGLVVLSTVRFVRTARLIDDGASHAASSVRTELLLCAFLVLVVASYGIYLALG
jgi:putative membrane protein